MIIKVEADSANFEIFSPQHHHHHPPRRLELLSTVFLTWFTRRIRLYTPFDRGTSGCGVIIKDVTDFCSSREFSPPPTSTTFNYNQDFLEGGFYTSVAR
jgi:hypothetical protein